MHGIRDALFLQSEIRGEQLILDAVVGTAVQTFRKREIRTHQDKKLPKGLLSYRKILPRHT